MKKASVMVGLIFCILCALPCFAAENVIYGCYQKNNGQLRVVQNSSGCNPSEIPISWNIAGPQGPAGPAGQDGAQGPEGPPGPRGEGAVFVYDAGKKPIGTFIAIDSSTFSVSIPISTTEKKFFRFRLSDGKNLYDARKLAVGSDGYGFYYLEGSCTGVPYVNINPSSLASIPYFIVTTEFSTGPEHYYVSGGLYAGDYAEFKGWHSPTSDLCQTPTSIPTSLYPLTEFFFPPDYTYPVARPLYLE